GAGSRAMVGTGPGGRTSALARCSIVAYDGAVLYDRYVRPPEPVVDYRTRWSGVRPRHLQGAVPFAAARRQPLPESPELREKQDGAASATAGGMGMGAAALPLVPSRDAGRAAASRGPGAAPSEGLASGRVFPRAAADPGRFLRCGTDVPAPAAPPRPRLRAGTSLIYLRQGQ
uniref:Interferon stimulated exonuclease gene 20 like 2 n=1 Tax=Nothoprocta perdicaria TaxID=30464 RepID=A0A8C6YM99_NOTPE